MCLIATRFSAVSLNKCPTSLQKFWSQTDLSTVLSWKRSTFQIFRTLAVFLFFALQHHNDCSLCSILSPNNHNKILQVWLAQCKTHNTEPVKTWSNKFYCVDGSSSHVEMMTSGCSGNVLLQIPNLNLWNLGCSSPSFWLRIRKLWPQKKTGTKHPSQWLLSTSLSGPFCLIADMIV